MTPAPPHRDTDKTERLTMPVPPDGYAALAIVAAIVLEWWAPLRLLPEPALLAPATLVGAILAACGLVLEISAARALVDRGTTTRPNGVPAALATGGPFRFTRNPFYCGIVLVLAGLFVAASLDWGFAVIPAFCLALDRLVVPFEERRLRAAFGAAYAEYARTTPRWLLK